MENGSHVIQSHTDPRTASFGNVSVQGSEKGFDVTPGDICALRLLEDGLQSFAVFAVHDGIISHVDTMCKSLLHGVADRRRESRWGTGQGAGCGGDRGGEVEMNSRICQFACPPGSSTY